MFKRILFTGALFAAGTASAQEVAISGKDFLSGAGDAKIAEIARQAAASGKVVVITAPKYWQDKAAAKVHAGRAQCQRASERWVFRKRDGAGRGQSCAKAGRDARAEGRTRTPGGRGASAQSRAKDQVAASPKTGASRSNVAAPPPAPVSRSKPAARASAGNAAAATLLLRRQRRCCTAARSGSQADASASRSGDRDQAAPRAESQWRQVGGRHLAGCAIAEGRPLFVDGPVRAVVRRFGPRTQLFWLEGDLNLERAELVPTGNDRYRVSEPIRDVANPTLRAPASNAPLKFTGNVPAPELAGATTLQQQYNEAHEIAESLPPSGLAPWRRDSSRHRAVRSSCVARRHGVRALLAGRRAGFASSRPAAARYCLPGVDRYHQIGKSLRVADVATRNSGLRAGEYLVCTVGHFLRRDQCVWPELGHSGSNSVLSRMQLSEIGAQFRCCDVDFCRACIDLRTDPVGIAVSQACDDTTDGFCRGRRTCCSCSHAIIAQRHCTDEILRQQVFLALVERYIFSCNDEIACRGNNRIGHTAVRMHGNTSIVHDADMAEYRLIVRADTAAGYSDGKDQQRNVFSKRHSRFLDLHHRPD